MIRLRLLSAILLLAVISFISPSFAADALDANTFGGYVGISPNAASKGLSMEESKIRFSVGSSGITLTRNIRENKQLFEFQVHYSQQWIFKLRGVNECPAVRQGLGSDLAQLIFCFFPYTKEPSEAVMILGEGFPAILGVFIREEKDGEGILEDLYRSFYQPARKNQVSWLEPIDIEYAVSIMKFGTREEKIRILDRATYNVWTGTEEEIKERFGLVSMGLRDADPEIQERALMPFEVGGRVVHGVDILVSFLSDYKSLKYYVLEEALQAAGYLIYESYKLNKVTAALEDTFGTSDIAAIYDKTGGIINPEHFEGLEEISRREPKLRWTVAHQTQLRDAIKSVVADTNVHLQTRNKGEKILAKYPLPLISRSTNGDSRISESP